ncbi:hypothetical protein [Inquilinus limosus]|uniref:hypothetical protein n=1 Tax=Inquilinus limosus TaxID=171674 RepID=UPI00126A6049|nr:hypothetical protein [Inquilinus limosus]
MANTKVAKEMPLAEALRWNPTLLSTTSTKLGSPKVGDLFEESMIGQLPQSAIVLGWATGGSKDHMGVAGLSENNVGVYGQSQNGWAGMFIGNVSVDGDINTSGWVHAKNVKCLGADCAENFAVASAAAIKPGSVMVLGDDGLLHPCSAEYDVKAAGVISGAGAFRPGLLLDFRDDVTGMLPLALVGKVYCMVDADGAAIETGDLLTTSSTTGHAMKAQDRNRMAGAIVGKALQPMKAGKGLIPILVSLQ